MRILSPDKTALFPTPLHPHLQRTGVLADGSCFLHAVCHALFQSYRNAPKKARTMFIQKLRKTLSDQLTSERFKELGQGEVFRFLFVQHLTRLVRDDNVLAACVREWKTTDVHDLTSHLPPSISSSVLEKLEEKVLEKYRCHLRDAWVDELGVEVVSDYFRSNIYFLDADTRHIYRTSTSQAKYRRNIVLLWVDKSHYECVSEYVDEERSPQYVFTDEDTLICSIRR